MWYALQTLIVGWIAYVYLTEVSDQKDIFHALFIGVIVAFYATFILTGILNTTRALIRAIRSKLLRPSLRAHKKPDKLVHVSGSRRSRPPRLISKI